MYPTSFSKFQFHASILFFKLSIQLLSKVTQHEQGSGTHVQHRKKEEDGSGFWKAHTQQVYLLT